MVTWYGSFHINAIPGIVTYTVTGQDSTGGMLSCNQRTFMFTIKSCHEAWAISPCYGGTMMLGMRGDSIGATYFWYGPKGFTSTSHDPTKYPAVYTDSGMYYVVRTIGGVHDTDSIFVHVWEKPVIAASNNSPMCTGDMNPDTLQLKANPYVAGETFSWSGPSGFTSGVQNPVLNTFTNTDTGIYTVIVTTDHGCKDTASTHAYLIQQPLPPVIAGTKVYCQSDSVTSFSATPSTVLWYVAPVGGVGTTALPKPYDSTKIVDTFTIFATVKIGSCESDRASFGYRVNRNPKAPTVTGTFDYCQYADTFVPVSVALDPAGGAYALWYTSSTGGTGSKIAPVVNTKIAGTYNYWVSQMLGNCESPRTPVSIVVHPKPVPPSAAAGPYCQFDGALQLTTSKTSGGVIKWYTAYDTTKGYTIAPTPGTLVPGYDTFFVNEISSFGCASNMQMVVVKIKPKPSAPLTRDTTYCQFSKVPALTADSLDASRLVWYKDGSKLAVPPVPTNAMPGTETWFVSQVVDGCESDQTAIKVLTIYKPQFSIMASSPYVCQFDSLWFAYKGPSLVDPAYVWSLPTGASYTLNGEGRSLPTDSVVYVKFDSVAANNYVQLHVTNNHGFCAGDTSFRIKIVPHPTGTSSTKADVCAGDTVSLQLGAKSPNASDFDWRVDGQPLMDNTILSVIAHNSNSGGPFSVSWHDSGRHVITLLTSTEEGCRSIPTDDTINVHNAPDATFTFQTKGGQLCLEDSVMFIAATNNYNYSYLWTPEHYFNNINKGVTWGKVENNHSIVTLRVTDPFGCYATTTQELDPGSCCTVGFPNSFTPNGDGKNDFFRPIFVGYHRFHTFRIANRWGQTVYEGSQSNMKWDGTYNGVPQDMGVYFYYIKYDCGGQTLEKKGDVTLIR